LLSSHCWIWLRGAAPTFWAIGWNRLAALEQQHRRDSAHSVARRNVRVLVDVQLGHRDLVAEVVRDFLERRRDHPARTAPFRPEIHQHRT